ncbi:toll/interleukin-1 receptor domain-containing protein [Akkermansia massiliensis]
MNKPVHIFISYCHEDRNFLKGLQDHMIALKRDGSCNAWTDREILAGDTLDKEISGSLDSADIVLLLVSVHFLNSTYCMSREFRKLYAGKRKREVPALSPSLHGPATGCPFLNWQS